VSAFGLGGVEITLIRDDGAVFCWLLTNTLSWSRRAAAMRWMPARGSAWNCRPNLLFAGSDRGLRDRSR